MPGFEVFGEEERRAINELFELNGGILFAHGFDAMRKGVYRVREFEAAFAARMGAPHAQAVSSCTAALRVALEALGIGPGHEVVIPCFTFVATAEAVIQTGADLVVVDVDRSLNMDPEALSAALTNRTRAVIPVHMMGAPADMDRIMAVAERHGLLVLEDAAQACGGAWRGTPLGTIGHMGAFSFDAGKVIITGEGGMVVTRDQDLFVRARAFHDHGHEYSGTVGRGEEGAIGNGFNYRMTELQGAIGLVQLGKLDMILEAQRRNKARLMGLLKGLPFEFRTILDPGELGDSLIFYLPDREAAAGFVDGLKREGLGTKNVPDAMRWHFAKHWGYMFKRYGWYRDSWREQWQRSADLLERAVALPVMVKMTDERIAEIAEKCLRIAEEI
ncbi:MAG: DegT/DnrJ/EryC1/StrS family aminotransferase [Desulfovibrionaceae bacterium]|nr:DegT/DnrJ/EryC1/StrS family aminotransferase [Desulfovibrionaceae bacterium]